MASSRLPGKILADIHGQPLLRHVLTRTRRARLIDRVVVATTEAAADDQVDAFCSEARVDCFRGSELDVLGRFYGAAAAFTATTIVRVTADCPFADPDVIDTIVGDYLQGGADYVSNVAPPTFPDGLDTEVFSRDALERTWRHAQMASEREHVTYHMYTHPELFRLRNITCEPDLSSLRWTVDEPDDLTFVRACFELLGERDFRMRDVMALLRDHSELTRINAGFARNEGLMRSLMEDKAWK